jgi:N-hydroxyarylamine O-acetyltransferase
MSPTDGDLLDLGAYLRRVEYDGPREPTPGVLEGLHLAHVTHIPFENLDPFLGRPVRLDLASLQAKLVAGRRGGYCFEQNTLFAAALEALGFRVTRLAARVRSGAASILPRTHMLLEVDAGREPWLADVGFGGEGLLRPVPLTPGRPVPQFHWTYRLTEEPGLWVLQTLRGGAWQDLYAFTREPLYPVDFEVANHFTATHPSSIFVRCLTAQLTTPEAHFVLRNREFSTDRGGAGSARVLVGDEEIRRLLTETFRLDLPEEMLAQALRSLPPPG